MKSFKPFIRNLFTTKSGTPDNLESGKSFEEKQNELGVFNYDTDGFLIQYSAIRERFLWNDITELNVYKADLMTYDRIELEIVVGEKVLTINEDLPGWDQFIQKTKIIFPSIPQEWDSEIIQPPFATNRRNIYKRPIP